MPPKPDVHDQHKSIVVKIARHGQKIKTFFLGMLGKRVYGGLLGYFPE